MFIWNNRTFEGLTEVCAYAAIMMQLFNFGKMFTHFCHVGWLSSTCFGYLADGMRVPQIISFFVYMACFVNYAYQTKVYMQPIDPGCVSNYVLTIISALWWIHNAYSVYRLGAGDFSKL